MPEDEETQSRVLPRRHEPSSVLTARRVPKDLGRLASIDESSLVPGFVLWDRFCVIDAPRITDGQLIVAVTDLERDPERVFGDTLEPRLELHRLPAPSASERTRWERAISVSNRVQAHIHAQAQTSDGFAVLLCEPAAGVLVTDAAPGQGLAIEGRKLLVFAYELAGLLSALHEAGVAGVRFDLDRLRVDGGHYHIDGFTHLLGGSPEGDLEALLEQIREVGGEAAGPLIEPLPSSAAQLWRRLRTEDRIGDLAELPPEPPFVGREPALAKLDHGLDQAQIARPTTLVVRGPRGVGKSRLLREFAAKRLQANDSLVLTGVWEGQGADTRGGLLGALDQLTRALSRLGLDERDDIRVRINYAVRDAGAIVARSAPSLGSVLRRVEELPPLELGEEFTRHTAVIAELLRALGTRKRPLVLILDNLESADSSSIAVLRILAEASPAHHSVVLTGFRTDGGGQQPSDLDAVELDLSPLGVGEVSELLAETLPGSVEDLESVAKLLWSGSNGLPLAIWATLRAWLDRGYLNRSVDDGVWRARSTVGSELGAEPSVQGLFAPRLAAASKPIREFMLHAAVLGAELTDNEVRYLCEQLDTDPDSAIAEVVGLGVLIRSGDGVRSPHSSIREFVLESFDESERRAAHHRVAEMLAKQQAPIASIAYHRDLAFDPDTEGSAASDRLSRLHVEAGSERLGVYDLERARWHLERALEHSCDTDQRDLAAEGLADICLLLNDLDSAVSLYTAIIATAGGIQSLRTAAKVAQFLFFQSAFSDGVQLGAMAFEQVNEPTPTTPFGRIALFFGSLIRSWFGPPKMEDELRDALCRLHNWMVQMSLIDDPLAMLAYVARSRWLAKGLETASAAMIISNEAVVLWGGIMGNYDHASGLFAHAVDITLRVNDMWAEGYVRHNWALNLFAADRYEEAQEMGDDGIGALRAAGDPSPTTILIMFKGLFGRDREPADRVLRWFDEAIATARRNGKILVLAPLECLKLHIFARQGRADLKPRLLEAVEWVQRDEVSAIERLIARTHLAFAALECAEWEIGVGQVRQAIIDFSEGPGVPEFCQEFYLAAALILMEQPDPSGADRKLLRSCVRKFRRFAKRSPRLGIYGDLLDLRIALKARNNQKIRATASKIVAEFDVHENLYMAHHAHRALSNLLKGENVLAAAEHERMARKHGRRLGLGDQHMLSDLTDVHDEMLELGIESGAKLEDSLPFVPAAGMLASTGKLESLPAAKRARYGIEEQSDVLEAWALTGNQVVQTTLGDVITPVRAAAGGSIDKENLEISCPNPTMAVPIDSTDLQVLVINMLLACRDALDPDARFSVRLDEEEVEATKSMGRIKVIEPGRYLLIRVSARGAGVQNPVIGGFSTCEGLVHRLGGQLSASTDKAQVVLIAVIPANEAQVESEAAPLPATVIVHPELSVRDALGAALDELGAHWRAFEPHEFGPAKIEQAKVILADSGSLDDLVILGPLLNARLFELVEQGSEPMFHDQEQLRLPIILSQLEDALRRS